MFNRVLGYFQRSPFLRQARYLFGSNASYHGMVIMPHQAPKVLNEHFNLFTFGVGASVAAWLASNNSVSAHSPCDLSPESLKDLLINADGLFDKNEFEKLYELLLLHKDSEKEEILWRLGRATYKRATLAKETSQKNSLTKEALAYVQRAHELEKNNFAIHKWMAIILDAASAIEGSKARIIQTFNVKDHMQKACELNPKDGTSWHVLALWHYNIADIPWYQRKAATVIFATPPESSFDEALKFFLHAEDVEPNFYSKNFLMIGKCYEKLKQPENAVIYFKKARDFVKTAAHPTQDDKEAFEEASQLLTQMGAS